MGRYLLARLLLFVFNVWLAVTAVFFIFRLVPGDPAQLIAGELAPEDVVQSIRRQLGLDQPLHVQYLRYLGGLLRGDLGVSKVYQQRAIDQISARLPATLLLALAAMGVAFSIGISAGLAAAVLRNSWFDNLILGLAVLGVSVPGFWLGLMLIMVFAVGLGLLPVSGFGTPAALILPAATLAANQLAVIARMTRAGMLEVLAQDYIRTARAKGLPERLVLLRHALKNALIPTVTVAGLQLGYLLGGSVVVETVFAWPGLGRLMVESVQFRDYTMVQGVVLVYAVGSLAVNLLVDLIYSALDPRIRYA